MKNWVLTVSEINFALIHHPLQHRYAFTNRHTHFLLTTAHTGSSSYESILCVYRMSCTHDDLLFWYRVSFYMYLNIIQK